MTHPAPTPTPADVQALLDTLAAERESLRALVEGAPGEATIELVDAVDRIGEHLLVADEELRVQQEQLTQSSRQLDLLVAAHEELFANATVGLVQTDGDGVIVRFNAAARRTLDLPVNSRRSLFLPNLVSPADRTAVRGLISRLRLIGTSAEASLEVIVARHDGRQLPVLLTARRSTDGGTGRLLLHWEVAERTARAPAHRAAADAPASAQTIAEATARMSTAGSPQAVCREAVVALASLVTPDAEAGITLLQPHRYPDAPAASGTLAAVADRLQISADDGPSLAVAREGKAVLLHDARRQDGWAMFAAAAEELGIAAVLSVPVTGPRGLAGALTLYAREPAAFTGGDVSLARAFAVHAGIAISAVEIETNLRNAMRTREEVGRAVGILMERHRIDAGAAFEMLKALSQSSHVKLRDIAARIAQTGEDITDVAASYLH